MDKVQQELKELRAQGPASCKTNEDIDEYLSIISAKNKEIEKKNLKIQENNQKAKGSHAIEEKMTQYEKKYNEEVAKNEDLYQKLKEQEKLNLQLSTKISDLKGELRYWMSNPGGNEAYSTSSEPMSNEAQNKLISKMRELLKFTKDSLKTHSASNSESLKGFERSLEEKASELERLMKAN